MAHKQRRLDYPQNVFGQRFLRMFPTTALFVLSLPPGPHSGNSCTNFCCRFALWRITVLPSPLCICCLCRSVQDEFEGVDTTEDEEDPHANEDAPPGRLLEEGGGSDSQEDDDEDNDDDDDHEASSSESEEGRSGSEEEQEEGDEFASYSGEDVVLMPCCHVLLDHAAMCYYHRQPRCHFCCTTRPTSLLHGHGVTGAIRILRRCC